MATQTKLILVTGATGQQGGAVARALMNKGQKIIEELGNAGWVKWVSGRPGEAPAYAGTDFFIVRGGH